MLVTVFSVTNTDRQTDEVGSGEQVGRFFDCLFVSGFSFGEGWGGEGGIWFGLYLGFFSAGLLICFLSLIFLSVTALIA